MMDPRERRDKEDVGRSLISEQLPFSKALRDFRLETERALVRSGFEERLKRYGPVDTADIRVLEVDSGWSVSENLEKAGVSIGHVVILGMPGMRIDDKMIYLDDRTVHREGNLTGKEEGKYSLEFNLSVSSPLSLPSVRLSFPEKKDGEVFISGDSSQGLNKEVVIGNGDLELGPTKIRKWRGLERVVEDREGVLFFAINNVPVSDMYDGAVHVSSLRLPVGWKAALEKEKKSAGAEEIDSAIVTEELVPGRADTELRGKIKLVFERLGLPEKLLEDASVLVPRVEVQGNSRGYSEDPVKNIPIVVVAPSNVKIAKDSPIVIKSEDGERLLVSMESMMPNMGGAYWFELNLPEGVDGESVFIDGTASDRRDSQVKVENVDLLLGTLRASDGSGSWRNALLVVLSDVEDGVCINKLHVSSVSLPDGHEELRSDYLVERRLGGAGELSIREPLEGEELVKRVEGEVKDALNRVGFGRRAKGLDLGEIPVIEREMQGEMFPVFLLGVSREEMDDIMFYTFIANEFIGYTDLDEEGNRLKIGRRAIREDRLSFNIGRDGNNHRILLPVPQRDENVAYIDGAGWERDDGAIIVEPDRLYFGSGRFSSGEPGRDEMLEGGLLVAFEKVARNAGGAREKIYIASLLLPKEWRDILKGRRLKVVKKDAPQVVPEKPAEVISPFNVKIKEMMGRIRGMGGFWVFKEISDSVDKFPVYGGMARKPEGTRVGYYENDGVKIPVDIRRTENGVYFEFSRLNLAGLLTQKDEPAIGSLEELGKGNDRLGLEVYYDKNGSLHGLKVSAKALVWNTVTLKFEEVTVAGNPKAEKALHNLNEFFEDPLNFPFTFCHLKPAEKRSAAFVRPERNRGRGEGLRKPRRESNHTPNFMSTGFTAEVYRYDGGMRPAAVLTKKEAAVLAERDRQSGEAEKKAYWAQKLKQKEKSRAGKNKKK